MKTLIINIKINAIKLVSGGGHCGCSSKDGLQKSLIMERANAEECKNTCCTFGSKWDMAHFIHDIEKGSKPISMHCPPKLILSDLFPDLPHVNKPALDDIDYFFSGSK